MSPTHTLPKLVLATRNEHKSVELKQLLATAPVETVDLSAFPDAPLVDEIASSIKENAALKALSAHNHSTHWALGDDTGLCIDVLGGRPGVHSARFAGQSADSRANRTLVLDLLAEQSDRRAHFITVLALARPEGVDYFEGALHGRIVTSSQSDQGFGYESIFIPDGFNVSLAQISREEKNKISHRAHSVIKLIRFINNL